MNTEEQILLLNYGAGNADQLPQATMNLVQIYIVLTQSDLWLLQHHFPNLYSSGKLVACNYGRREETLLTNRKLY